MTAAVAVAPVLPSSLLPSPTPMVVASSSAPLSSESVRKRPLLPDEGNNDKKSNKKLQLRYDPDVPMSKEETAVWRREQRRKRNRESAAASRQRQRDRITELEQQVDYYKQALQSINAKIQALEQQQTTPSTLPDPPLITSSPTEVSVKNEDSMDDLSIVTQELVARVETPEPEPIVSFCPSPTTSTFMDFTGSEIVKEMVPKNDFEGFSSTSSPQPLKMISRHAESRIIIPATTTIILSFLKPYLNYVGNVTR